MIVIPGPNTLRGLKTAIDNQDENKAIEVYLALLTSSRLSISPSDPLSISRKSGNSLLLLAGKKGLGSIFLMFLENGGNPNCTNNYNETCLHAVCSGSDRHYQRTEMVKALVDWKKKLDDGTFEAMSINHADVDGNSALHHAAANGLLGCIFVLIEVNSIISIVNKSQMTCCELADERKHKEISDMLELALLFQPDENNDEIVSAMQLGDDGTPRTQARRRGRMFSKSSSLNVTEIQAFMDESVDFVVKSLNEIELIIATNNNFETLHSLDITRERAEMFLDMYSWNLKSLVSDYGLDPLAVFRKCGIDPTLFKSEALHSREHNIISGNEICEDDIIVTDITTSTPHRNQEIVQCPICMDDMSLPSYQYPLSTYDWSVVEGATPSISCCSNHTFCFNCWSQHTITQVTDLGSYCLTCPQYKCKEVLDSQVWGRFLLKSPNLFQRLVDLKRKHVIDCYSHSWKWCPHPNCSLVVACEPCDPLEDLRQLFRPSSSSNLLSRANSTNSLYSEESLSPRTPQKSLGAVDDRQIRELLRGTPQHTPKSRKLESPSSPSDSSSVIPSSAICSNLHSFCLQCGGSSHTPSTCSQWQR